jgi:hypothetical protein
MTTKASCLSGQTTGCEEKRNLGIIYRPIVFSFECGIYLEAQRRTTYC